MGRFGRSGNSSVSAFQVLIHLAGCAMVLVVSFAALFGKLEISSYFRLLVDSMTMFSGFEQSVSKIPMLRIMEASLLFCVAKYTLSNL